MSKKVITIFAIIILAGAVLLTLSYIFKGREEKKEPLVDKSAVVNKLFQEYRNGSISECEYDEDKEDDEEGELYYSAGINAYDAGRIIYDKWGKKAAECNYAWGKVDTLCSLLEGCETVYAVENNIWGYGYINRYGLK